MATQKDKELEGKSTKGVAGVFIPAGLFLGMAYGFLNDNVPVGIFGGLGIGFLLFGIVMVFKKD